MLERSDYQLDRQLVDVGLAWMENALRKINMVDKIWKVLSLQTQSAVECVICTALFIETFQLINYLW